MYSIQLIIKLTSSLHSCNQKFELFLFNTLEPIKRLSFCININNFLRALTLSTDNVSLHI